MGRRSAGLADGTLVKRCWSGKIIVNADLSVPGDPEIFAIGDTAHVVAARQLIFSSSFQLRTYQLRPISG